MQVEAAGGTMLSPIFNILLTIDLRKTGKLPRILNRGGKVPLLHLCFEKILLAAM